MRFKETAWRKRWLKRLEKTQNPHFAKSMRGKAKDKEVSKKAYAVAKAVKKATLKGVLE